MRARVRPRLSAWTRLFDAPEEPRPDARAAGRPARRAHAPAHARASSSGRSTCSARARRCARAIESGRAALDDPLRAAGHGQDDARADDRRARRRRLRGALRRPGRAGRGARGDRARPRAAPRRARARSSSSTRSTASTRPSRTRCCPRSRTGSVTLVGATTENPYFEVNSALLSRAQVYELRALTAEDVAGLLRRALERGECGEHGVDDEAIAFLAARSGGDARAALNALELALRDGRRGRAT